MDQLALRAWAHFGIDPAGAMAVVIAATVLYLLYAAVLQLLGPRLMAGGSTLSFAIMALLGALCARGMLGDTPTMTGTIIAVLTLFFWEYVGLRLAQGAVGSRVRSYRPHPAVVMVEGVALRRGLKRRRISEGYLIQRLRANGVLRRDDAALVILENRGGVTVVRHGETIDREFLDEVDGVEDIPHYLIRD